MKEYDFAFSLGYCCTCSESLRAEGLQFASTPFDWTGYSNVLQAPRLIATDFKDWFDRDALELWDVRMLGGFVTRVYRNAKTGVGFIHEFSNAEPFDTHYEKVKEKFDRRIARFQKALGAAKRVLAVYLELPKNQRAADDDLIEARRLLCARYPEAEIDLLYLYEDPDEKAWTQESVAPGIIAARMDYRMYLNGTLMHTCRNEQIRACLRTLARVKDPRTEEEKAQFAAYKANEKRTAFGKTRWQNWINKKLVQKFRDLESYLEKQLIIPGDRPLWFDGDGK